MMSTHFVNVKSVTMKFVTSVRSQVRIWMVETMVILYPNNPTQIYVYIHIINIYTYIFIYIIIHTPNIYIYICNNCLIHWFMYLCIHFPWSGTHTVRSSRSWCSGVSTTRRTSSECLNGRAGPPGGWRPGWRGIEDIEVLKSLRRDMWQTPQKCVVPRNVEWC